MIETRPLLLGHRGARGEKSVPENTLAAFDLALADGCHGFEFDVRLTADGEAVICHDASIGGRNIAEVSARDLALPSLREVLARYRDFAFLDIELKVAGLEKIASDLLSECVPTRGFVVSSFFPEVLQALCKLDDAIPLGIICETQAQLSTWREVPVSYVIPHYKLLRYDMLDKLKRANKKILVWTVNAPAAMRRFAERGVDGIISDHPRLLALTLRSTNDLDEK